MATCARVEDERCHRGALVSGACGHTVALRRAGSDTPRRTVHAEGYTSIDEQAVAALYDTPLPAGTKGVSFTGRQLVLRDVAESRWQVLSGSVPMPVMVLKQSALDANLRSMVDYCTENQVLLSPHGKTTMAPQLFARQVRAGAWALTCATPAHLRLYRAFGVQRILYANQLVEPTVIDWIADELERDRTFEFVCLVDSTDSVELLAHGLEGRSLPRPIGVLLEVGYRSGRCGVRTMAAAAEVARQVDRTPALTLRGVECFEGLLGYADGTVDLDEVDGFLSFVRAVARHLLLRSSLREASEMIVSAGGTAFFDRVVHAFVASWEHQTPARVVLRSGCYITHDGGFYGKVSPLAARSRSAPAARDAIEVWSAVLSRPEPDLIICSLGRRDVPQDMGLPRPTMISVRGRAPEPLPAGSVIGLSDQHAHVRVRDDCPLRPGDLVGMAISHPCTAFDRWRVIPIIDDAYVIRDAIVTFF